MAIDNSINELDEFNFVKAANPEEFQEHYYIAAEAIVEPMGLTNKELNEYQIFMDEQSESWIKFITESFGFEWQNIGFAYLRYGYI